MMQKLSTVRVQKLFWSELFSLLNLPRAWLDKGTVLLVYPYSAIKKG